ncbi:MAG: response regulator transcription factor [Cytophagaceae bacterium]
MKIFVVPGNNSFPDNQSKDALWEIDLPASATEISEKVYLYEYDCILFYGTFDSKEWKELLQSIPHNNTNTGLILLSHEISVEQKVKALNAGADDCLILPIHPDELKARVLAIVRRKKFNAGKQINFANTSINLEQRQIFVWNTPIALTPKEYDILLYFIMNRTKIVTPTLLSEYLWGDASDEKESGNLLITHIKNLRKKLKQTKAEIEIKNIYATGYQILEL